MKTFKEVIGKLIAMIAIVKNLPLITVLMATKKTSTTALIKMCNLQKTLGDPLVVAPPVSDTTIKSQAATLETLNNESETNPPTATKLQVTTQRNICINSYNQNAAYIQGIARNAAISSGDVSVGEQVVNRCNYKYKKTKAATTRAFKVTNVGVGAVQITTKAVAVKAGYIRQYGPTTAKGVPPAVIAEDLYTLEVNVYLSNLKSGTMYAFREATILPLSRATTSSTPTTVVKKVATPIVATKSHKVSFTDGTEHYSWSNWFYLGVE
jgi:hypothetical protein